MLHNRQKIKLQILLIIITVLLTTTTALAQGVEGIVIASRGIVRVSNNFEAKIIDTLDIGTKVSITEKQGDWYSVELEDAAIEGWMYKDIIASNNKNQGSIKKGIITASRLNVRATPSLNGNIITQLINGTQVTILETLDEWYQIQLSTGPKGFVHTNFVTLIPNHPEGKILENNVNLISSPNGEAQVIVSLNKDESIYIKGYENGFYQVLRENFTEGWVDSNFVELQINIISPVNRSGTRSHGLSNIKTVAEKYLGTPYRFGGNGPNSFDCSGFVSYILNTYYKDYLEEKGINLPRVSRDQANVGTTISKDQLRVGDLVFFNNGNNKTINHVGIYIGNNEFIHASSGGNKAVIISSLGAANYIRRYSKAIRL